MPHAKPRIPADRLKFAHDPLFGRSAFTGAALARDMGVQEVTLWSWFSRRGLTPGDARKAADAVDRWADDLYDIVERLREVANERDEAPDDAGASDGGTVLQGVVPVVGVPAGA